jgi:hypothetical protein
MIARFVIAALSFVVLPQFALAVHHQDRKPTSPELKAQILATIDLLETDPYHKDAEG